MEFPRAQEKSKQLFFAQPKVPKIKVLKTNKTVTTDPLWFISFFEQCQADDKAFGILEKIIKDKKQPKEKKMAHLLVTCSHESSYRQHCCNKPIIINTTNAVGMTDNPTIIIEMINATINLVAMTRTIRATSPMRRRMIASAITPRKRVTRPCTMTSSLCQVRTPRSEKGFALTQNILLTLVPVLALAQAAGPTTTIMWLAMIASQAHSPSVGTRTPPRAMTMDVSIALTRAIMLLPPSLLQRKRKVNAQK
jgi:hypothetical protein